MMKRLFPLFLLLALMACSEQTPEIPCLSCDREPDQPEPQQKKVLIEEFTGVRCVQCPAGSAEIESLLDFYGESMIAVSIHAGFFSLPFSNSIFNFQTDEGQSLNSFLDEPIGYPTAVINRKLFTSEDDLQLDRNSWGGYVAQELELITQVNINVDLNYEPGNRKLEVETDITPLVDQTGELRISVMLTETEIVDVQQTPNGVQDDYIHRHVLRDMLTTFDGSVINEAFMAGSTIERDYSVTLDADWEANHMEVIVFVHRGGGEREVLQVETAHLPE